jgi:integrase
MACIGDMPAAAVTALDVERILTKVARTDVSPRVVNEYRAIVSAVYGYGVKPTSFGLSRNPVVGVDKRREPQRGVLVYFSPEEIEAVARALAAGRHRSTDPLQISEQDRAEDRQDAEIIRVAAYAGLRLGELRALRWRDVDFGGHALTISRAISEGVECSTKSGRVRRVPLPDQAAAALDRLSMRGDFTSPDDRVFCNVLGRTLDGSALRRRFKRARDAAGLRPLRFHDLRHTYGSLLAAGGVDLVTIQAAMGHAALVTTSRYLHARPAAEQAARFTQIFQADPNAELLAVEQ